MVMSYISPNASPKDVTEASYLYFRLEEERTTTKVWSVINKEGTEVGCGGDSLSTVNRGEEMRTKKEKPVCEQCGAPATRANFGPKTGQMNYLTGKVVETNNPSYLCETDFETYKLSHS